MIALYPLFLGMLPLAGLPVLFHLLVKLRTRHYLFSTLMFFHQIDPRLSARRRIREWLTLILRMLFIVLLLLALARPVIPGTGGRGAIAAIMLIDNSGSMSAPAPGGKTKLNLALETAAALLAALDSKDTAGIVPLVPDPDWPLPEELTADKPSLIDALNRSRETEAAGNVAAALRRAGTMLAAGRASACEIHIFTDLQEHEWGQPSLLNPPARLPPGADIFVHRLASAPASGPGIILTDMAVPRRRLLAGRRLSVRVTLANPTAADAVARLQSVDDNGEQQSRNIAVPPAGETVAEIQTTPAGAGAHWLMSWVEGAGFTFANRGAAAFVCSAGERALFIGPTNAFGLLPLALAPSGDGRLSGIEPVFVEASAARPSLTVPQPILAVLTWPAFDADQDGSLTQALRTFVEQGGSLLMVPPLSGATPAANIPEWIGALPEKSVATPAGAPLAVLSKSAPMLQDLRDDQGRIALRNTRAFIFNPLRLAPEAAAIIGTTDGRTILAERQLDRGRVFSSGLAFTPEWSNLPLKGACLALVQSMALASAEAADVTAVGNIVAGEQPPAPPPARAETRISTLAGAPLDWKGGSRELPVFARCGVYALQTGAGQITLAVSASAPEGIPRFIAGDAVPALGALVYSVKTLAGAETLAAEAAAARSGRDLYLPLILLALLTLMLEGWSANRVKIGAVAPMNRTT